MRNEAEPPNPTITDQTVCADCLRKIKEITPDAANYLCCFRLLCPECYPKHVAASMALHDRAAAWNPSNETNTKCPYNHEVQFAVGSIIVAPCVLTDGHFEKHKDGFGYEWGVTMLVPEGVDPAVARKILETQVQGKD